MRNTILIIVLSLVFFSCNKDLSGTSPGLTFKSVNTTVVQPSQEIEFTLSFGDVNGNLDSLYIYSVSQTCPKAFSDSASISYFPTFKNQAGTLLVTYLNGGGNGFQPTINDSCASGINDTCYFKFIIKDFSGKISDTVRSPQIVLIKP